MYFISNVFTLLRSFVTFPKISLATFIQKSFEKFRISQPLSCQMSAAGIFIKLKALDISLTCFLL